MTRRTPTMTIDDLPARTTRLSPGDLRDVFGGCQEEGQRCAEVSECCGDLECKSEGIDICTWKTIDEPFST